MNSTTNRHPAPLRRVLSRRLIIEVGCTDAAYKPRIKDQGSPLYAHPDWTSSGQQELEGYLLNATDGPCVFLDRRTNLCSIYDTRPWVCRLFDCDAEGKEQILQLDIKPGAQGRAP